MKTEKFRSRKLNERRKLNFPTSAKLRELNLDLVWGNFPSLNWIAKPTKSKSIILSLHWKGKFQVHRRAPTHSNDPETSCLTYLYKCRGKYARAFLVLFLGHTEKFFVRRKSCVGMWSQGRNYCRWNFFEMRFPLKFYLLNLWFAWNSSNCVSCFSPGAGNWFFQDFPPDLL